MVDSPISRAPLGALAEILRRRFFSGDDGSATAVVVIVGAGASLESGFSTWRDEGLREELIQELGAVLGSEEAFVQEACYQLARYLPPSVSSSAGSRRRLLVKHARTEHLCGVAWSWQRGKETLVGFLQDKYGYKAAGPQPQLAYERLAHLVKHRFVDHIISLNFDEVLDAALTDELGRDGYRIVLPVRHSHIVDQQLRTSLL